MRISLIGMSNVGKTYWSKKLEVKGFHRLGCDDIIEQKLEKELKKQGYSGINDVAKWLGQPYEERYYKNSQKYLFFEKQAVITIIQKIKTYYNNHEKLVVDTTGSVIYLEKEIIDKLKKHTIMVYLDTPSSVQKKMFVSYIQNPKPVIWGDNFNKQKEQSNLQALKINYPKLLAYRTLKYKQYADINIDYAFQRSKQVTTNNFIDFIQSQQK